MMDVAAAIADLEAQRAKLDAAIAALRALQNGRPAPVLEPPPGAAPRRRAPAGRPEREVTPAEWDQALALWTAGALAADIATRLGITAAAVFYYAQEHGWPKRRRVVPPVLAAPEAVAGDAAQPVADPVRLEPRRRCASCAGMTDTDPCTFCGQALAP